MAPSKLVSIELRFTTSENADELADRIREAVRMIVGRDALEEFRSRTMPLEPPKDRIHPR
jgi:hypothetical protein